MTNQSDKSFTEDTLEQTLESGTHEANKITIEEMAFDHLLGSIDSKSATDFEDAMAVSPAARNAFLEAEEIANKLYLLAPEKTPPKAIWQNIHQRTSSQRTTDSTAKEKSLWSKIMPWLAGANGLLAAGLFALVIYPKAIDTAADQSAMPYTAVLQSQEAEPMWLLQASSDMSELVINNTKALSNPNKNQVCILWVESDAGMIPIAKVPVDGSKSILQLKPFYQQALAQDGKLFITTENAPKNNDNFMPEKPSDKMESSGKFLIKNIL